MTDHFDFSAALHALKDGRRVARAGWNGKGMWLKLVPAESYDVGCRVILDEGAQANDPNTPALLPWIGMKTADNKFVPWLASQTDMLAEDWTIAE